VLESQLANSTSNDLYTVVELCLPVGTVERCAERPPEGADLNIGGLSGSAVSHVEDYLLKTMGATFSPVLLENEEPGMVAPFLCSR
jgi:hypothetical protein